MEAVSAFALVVGAVSWRLHQFALRSKRRQRPSHPDPTWLAPIQAAGTVFSEISGNSTTLTFEQFNRYFMQKLHYDLDHSELRRIWRKHVSCTERCTQADFGRAAVSSGLIRDAVAHAAQTHEFALPRDYDYTLSTSENYADDRAPVDVGKYASSRSSRDYEYHSRYCPNRVQWQDSVISTVIRRSSPQPNPWIVFTARGFMDVAPWFFPAGINSARGSRLQVPQFRAIQERNAFSFPVTAFEYVIQVRASECRTVLINGSCAGFKRVMPEWQEYVRRSDEAGTLCHRESGFLCELAQEEAMRSSQNVWVDGSLRDSVWFGKVFDDIRVRHPQFKIAIFAISASKENVLARAENRGRQTGRHIPHSTLLDSMTSVAESLNVLTPKCDFVVRIDNNEKTPKLLSFESIDLSGNWAAVGLRFSRTHASPLDFPLSLPPILVKTVPTGGALLELLGDVGTLRGTETFGVRLLPGALSASSGLYRPQIAARLRSCLGQNETSLSLFCSPPHAVNLSQEMRETASIPLSAYTFAWLYPQPEFARRANEVFDTDDPEMRDDLLFRLLSLGGFVYFDFDANICCVNVQLHGFANHATWQTRMRSRSRQTSSDSDLDDAAAIFLDDISGGRVAMIQFEAARPLEASRADKLKLGRRWQPVVDPVLRHKGARLYAWLAPGERLGDTPGTPCGAMAFLFHE